jgi:hypothetical protein
MIEREVKEFVGRDQATDHGFHMAAVEQQDRTIASLGQRSKSVRCIAGHRDEHADGAADALT